MRQDIQPNTGGHRESPNLIRAMILVAVLTALVSFAWFYARLSPGTAFGPWQGSFLEEHPIYDLPLLSRWAAGGVNAIPWGNPAWRLNLLSAVLGAVCSGMTAAMIFLILRRALEAPHAALGAITGGLLFAGSTPVTYAGTGAGPSTLTACFGLASLVFLLVFVELPRKMFLLGLSALAAGLAAANHPTLGLLMVVVLFGVVLFDLAPARRLTVIFLLIGSFAVGASIPAVYAWMTGESLSAFLYHALRTAYPTVSGGTMDLGYYHKLAASFAYPALILAVPGVLLLLRPPSRVQGSICLLVFACFGPLLPFLTNHYGATYGLRDALAPQLMVTAMVAVCAGHGLGAAVGLMKRMGRRLSMALMLCVAVAAVLIQARAAPCRDHPYAERLARTVLEHCPANSVLICGTPDLASLIVSTQRATGVRPDVLAFSSDTLADDRLRGKLAANLQGKAIVDASDGSGVELDRLQSEQPFLVRRLIDAGSDPLQDIALWNFVRGNFTRRLVCFAGISSTWLSSRAQASGCVLVYPRGKDDGEQSPGVAIDEMLAATPGIRDPGLADTLNRLVLTLSEAARNQGWEEEAARLAAIAVRVSPDDSLAYLARARAEARQGLREQAADSARAYLQLFRGRGDAPSIVKLLEDDLRNHALKARFQEGVLRERGPSGDPRLRQDITPHLWETEQLATLHRGYESILERSPSDSDTLYETAAVLAQLGDLKRATEALNRWQTAGQIPEAMLRTSLEQDGRFALVRLSRAVRDSTQPVPLP